MENTFPSRRHRESKCPEAGIHLLYLRDKYKEGYSEAEQTKQSRVRVQAGDLDRAGHCGPYNGRILYKRITLSNAYLMEISGGCVGNGGKMARVGTVRTRMRCLL